MQAGTVKAGTVGSRLGAAWRSCRREAREATPTRNPRTQLEPRSRPSTISYADWGTGPPGNLHRAVGVSRSEDYGSGCGGRKRGSECLVYGEAASEQSGPRLRAGFL
ncbi:hypothetical protein NDU88_002721 [Pleurodeles waltl]|uniref:Uncharacterized protein n=1 Tax=Pleurodeles waltl TaxID=8319 RepID=A0AAV7P7U5_PLEWA|nr:hypothetical protein NDU88_002721 [Pleurodeles waltl]